MAAKTKTTRKKGTQLNDKTSAMLELAQQGMRYVDTLEGEHRMFLYRSPVAGGVNTVVFFPVNGITPPKMLANGKLVPIKVDSVRLFMG